MIRTYGEEQTLSPFPNTLFSFLPRRSHNSQKFDALLSSFEKTLADVLKKLNPEDISDVFSLCWMRNSVHCLVEIHIKLKSLVDELFPALNWDDKWIQMYLDDTVKLLEICNAITSQLYHLEHGQLFIRYLQHILDSSKDNPSSEQLRKAHVTLHDWMKQINTQSPNLRNGLAALQVLRGTLRVEKKAKNAQEKVLMRALYGFKFVTLTVCSIFLAALSGSPEPLTELPNPEKFQWIEAFNELKSNVSRVVDMQLSSKKFIQFKEVEAVQVWVLKLHELTGCCEEDLVLQNYGDSPKKIAEYGEQRLQECILRLSEDGEKLGGELDGLSAQVNEFFKMNLSGRDALLSNLRASGVTKEMK